VLKDAPTWVPSADAVLWDAANRALLFARHGNDGRYMTLVVRLDQREQRVNTPSLAAWVRAVESYTGHALRQHALVAGTLE
jgi:hypothetical protein